MKNYILIAGVIILFSSFIANKDKPVLHIIGDSTVKNGQGSGTEGLWGWGSLIAPYFDTSRITINNQALGGTSSRTFMNRGRWDKVYPMIKKGDFVLIQFGHNDGSPLDDTARARGTIKGNGSDSVIIYNPITKQQEIVHTYGWYLRKFICLIKEKKATPIICSPVPRNNWTNGMVNRADKNYGLWAKLAADQENVLFLNLNDLVADQYDKMGEHFVDSVYFTKKDHTHTSKDGAALNAEMVTKGISQLGINQLKRLFR